MVAYGNSVNSDVKMLDVAHLPEYTPIERVAYVHDVKIGMTRYESGFVTFILKDRNANTIAARLFDVEDFMFSGVNANALKHKPVKFKCVVQEYNGSLSIVFDGKEGITEYTGDFDYNGFIGKVESDTAELKTLFKELGFTESFDTVWKNSPIDKLCNGKLGAFNKMAEIAYSCLKPLVTEENREELVGAFAVTLNAYFEYLNSRQATEMLESLNAYDVLSKVQRKYEGNNSRLVFLDAASSVLDVAKPLHLYAHYVKGAISYAEMSITMSTRFESLPLGSKISFGGGQLSKY